MKILIVNPIIYTSETRDIKKVDTIKDTMIYDLCLGFKSLGIDVTLAACEDFKPAANEDYPFEIIWLKAKLKKLCPVNSLPFCPDIRRVISQNKYDLIITSEVFSLNSLMLVLKSRKNLIVWHELAKHNRIFKGIASRVWYGVIARLFFRKALVVPRSSEAKAFISKYCKTVTDEIIDHGVNLEKFTPEEKKQKQFAVSSQLISRKQIDKIISAFCDFINTYDSEYKLYIMGDGDEKDNLIRQVQKLGISDSVIFTGKLNHAKLTEILKNSQAMLVYTRQDNNMVSIVESIAVGTPVVTTSVPYNASYIRNNMLGIVDDNWDKEALKQIISTNLYIKNCFDYRQSLSTESKADTFLKIYNNEKQRKR